MKNVEQLEIRDLGDGAVLAVKVVPGSSRDRVAGVLGERLKVCTSAAAERGRANAAVAKSLAAALGVDRRTVTCVSGTTSPRKEYRIDGLSAEKLRVRLNKL